MKYLRYLIFFFLVLGFLFFVMGFIKPTVKYGHEITVNKALQDAWAIQQDETKMKDWLKGFQSIELISGQKGKVGSKYKVVIKPEPDQPDFIMTETVVSVKEYDHMTLSLDSEMMVFDQTTSFTENDGKTTIKTESVVKGKGIMMRSMFALMDLFGGSFKKQEVENIENLKKVIESS